MPAYTVRTRSDIPRVLRKIARQNIASLGQAGAFLRAVARRKFRRRKGPSRPGPPPHTHRRHLPNSIRFAVEPAPPARVLIGPDYRIIKAVGGAHERGGKFRGRRYPARPFMGPALESARPRLPKFWAASIRT